MYIYIYIKFLNDLLCTYISHNVFAVYTTQFALTQNN